MGIEDSILSMDELVKTIIILRNTPTNIHSSMNSQNHHKTYINQTSTSIINPRGKFTTTHSNQVIQKNHIYDKHNNEILEFRDTKKMRDEIHLKIYTTVARAPLMS